MNLPDIRCPVCHRLLLRGIVLVVEVRCPRCGYLYIQEIPAVVVEQIIFYLTPSAPRAIAYTELLMSP